MEVLRTVLTRIWTANLTVKPSKCYFAHQSVQFMGHSIQVGLIKTQDDKVIKIQDAKVPLTKKQVRSFLGLTGYYHKFIANYSELATPLTDFTKKGMPESVKWSPEANDAFEMLKTLLCKEPVLHLPNLDLPFVLRTAASANGMGAVLLQCIKQMYRQAKS